MSFSFDATMSLSTASGFFTERLLGASAGHIIQVKKLLSIVACLFKSSHLRAKKRVHGFECRTSILSSSFLFAGQFCPMPLNLAGSAAGRLAATRGTS